MLTVTDAAGVLRTLSGQARVVPGDDDLGTLLAVDTLRRAGGQLGVRVLVSGVAGMPSLNVHPGLDPGAADVVLSRPAGLELPSYGDPLALRLAWLTGASPEVAGAELSQWQRWVAGWAESPSKPISAEVQRDLLAALADDLATARAVAVLRGSLDLGLPPGCLFETWAWADHLLGLDLASRVGL
jgi:hypothetical protein